MEARVGQDLSGQHTLGQEVERLWIGTEVEPVTAWISARPPLDWLAACWAEGCGWEVKTRTEDAARASKAEHEARHLGHRVTAVRI
jgi:hypothetical protein